MFYEYGMLMLAYYIGNFEISFSLFILTAHHVILNFGGGEKRALEIKRLQFEVPHHTQERQNLE